jgi:hypothetical protein
VEILPLHCQVAAGEGRLELRDCGPLSSRAPRQPVEFMRAGMIEVGNCRFRVAIVLQSRFSMNALRHAASEIGPVPQFPIRS